MIRIKIAIGAMAAAVVLTVCLVATVWAGPAGNQGERVEAARFMLDASGGFTAKVDASGHRVTLTLTRRLKRREEIAQYTVEGQVSTREVHAEFGSLGSIAVQFHPTGVAKHMAPPNGCDGYYVPGQTGTFTGAIDFTGEGGYVRVDASSATGEAGASTRWSCRGRPNSPSEPGVIQTTSSPEQEEEAKAREYANLTAISTDRRFFRAVGGPVVGGGLPVFFAGATESKPPLRIYRVVVTLGGNGNFSFDDRLRSAVVRPPSPFQGSARFRRGRGDATHWSGSLRASLPGADNVSFVGSRFKAHLSHNLPGD